MSFCSLCNYNVVLANRKVQNSPWGGRGSLVNQRLNVRGTVWIILSIIKIILYKTVQFDYMQISRKSHERQQL